jgi:hypothetical protein
MKINLIFLLILIITPLKGQQASTSPADHDRQISIMWKDTIASGSVDISGGKLPVLSVESGKGRISSGNFRFSSKEGNRLGIKVTGGVTGNGSGASIVTLHAASRSFSFFLRDVSPDYPIYIPEYKVIVTDGQDLKSYKQIEAQIRAKKLKTNLEEIELAREESFDSAAVHTRDQICPTWLGISRDMRIFELGLPQDMDIITPRMASSPVKIPEAGESGVAYTYLAGRGQGVENNRTRRLDGGVLPILHSTQKDGDIEYNTTTFVTLERSPLKTDTPIGTDFMVADNSSYGHMFTDKQAEDLKQRIASETGKSEETVLYLRVTAKNLSGAPAYAWFRTVRPGSGWWEQIKHSYDPGTGFSGYSTNRIFGISKLNGEPLPDEEIAVLLKPGEEAKFEFLLPHEPLSEARARQLASCSFDKRLSECRDFWKEKLKKAATIALPEKRIQEMISAGLLHLDLITYGKEPNGTLAPSVGVYSPIGTESSPIMQTFMSMGWFDEARRSLMYFIDKQHEDGMIQNFGGYMVETGAALWSIGEYFRYTRDTAWIMEIEPQILKACDFLFSWRDRNKKENLIGKGYGMIDGKVADPEDQFHQYMLNGYAYLGISRAGEILAAADPSAAVRLNREAEAWKQDIRKSFYQSMAGSPAVPLRDGTWCPTVPPWTEAKAMRLLYLNHETFLSHGTFTVSDAMLGPLYLVFCEVFDPKEAAAEMLLKYHSDLFYQRNAAFSQPYYSRHNWMQIRLGLVKPFLKTYYNTFSALADRETYTFWEHLYKVSVHKTHEEAWFLMETRWMLWLEDGKTLRLLSGIPRKWMENGKSVKIENAASYFGPVSFSAESHLDQNYISAAVECTSERKPDEVSLRLPHPAGFFPVKITGGDYDKNTESVIIRHFSGRAEIRVEFSSTGR